MSSEPDSTYPDISDILARKADGRRELSARSFGEKIRILETMRAAAEPFRAAWLTRRDPSPADEPH